MPHGSVLNRMEGWAVIELSDDGPCFLGFNYSLCRRDPANRRRKLSTRSESFRLILGETRQLADGSQSSLLKCPVGLGVDRGMLTFASSPYSELGRMVFVRDPIQLANSS